MVGLRGLELVLIALLFFYRMTGIRKGKTFYKALAGFLHYPVEVAVLVGLAFPVQH
jgi:hypothetical protein